jgi:aspartyl-tRNA(Asn)/glutamyl-tRNA(Gln) amidotransferase subunit A
MQGVLPLSAYLDSIGPLAVSVECCAIMDAVLAGETYVPVVPHPLRGLRLLAPTNVVLDAMDETVGKAYRAALDKLAAAGAVIVEAEVPAFNALAAINAKGGFTAAEAYAWHRA